MIVSLQFKHIYNTVLIRYLLTCIQGTYYIIYILCMLCTYKLNLCVCRVHNLLF